MNLTRVRLSNFCQHADRDDSFGPGVVAIMGPNGCGKSNYLSALCYGLTGSSGNYGKKEDDLLWGAEKGSVQVDFTSNGRIGWIKRDVKTARCSMKFNDRDYKTSAEIDNIIYDLLGLQPRILTDMVFVRQGHIEGILFQKPADRAKSMQMLFGTANAERIREFLQIEITNLSLESRQRAIDESREKLVKLRAEKTSLELVLAEAAKKLLTKERYDELERLVRRYNIQQSAAETLQRTETEIQSATTLLSTARTTRDGLEKSARELSRVLTQEEPGVKKCQELLDNHRVFLSCVAQKIRLEETLRILTEDSSALEPVGQHTDTEIEILQKEYMQKYSSHAPLVSVVKSLHTGSGICPTCLQPISQEYREKHEHALSGLEVELRTAFDAFTKANNEHKAHRARHAAWRARKEIAEKQLASTQQELCDLKVPDIISEAAVNEASATIHDFDKAKASLIDIEKSFAVHKERAEQLEATLNQLIKSRDTQRTMIGTAVTEQEYKESQLSIGEHTKASIESAELHGRHSSVVKQEEEVRTYLATVEEEEKKLVPMRCWKDTLERARGLLHREQLPNLTAQVFVKAISAKMATYLEIFEAPYTARIASDMSIECTFSGNRRMPADRLSGGQRVMLGIAFRFAIYDLFVSNLGLLVLDEPTVYLDDDRVDDVFHLLERVKSYSKGKGLQLIVVTHEKRLTGVFDQVITLG